MALVACTLEESPTILTCIKREYLSHGLQRYVMDSCGVLFGGVWCKIVIGHTFLAKHVWRVIVNSPKSFYFQYSYRKILSCYYLSTKEVLSGQPGRGSPREIQVKWAPDGDARRGPAVDSDFMDRFRCQKYVLLCPRGIPIDVLLMIH